MPRIFLLAAALSPSRLLQRADSSAPPPPPWASDVKHEDIWRALDTLAAENGLSVSGLAKRAGLDATTFNPSKRLMPDGRPRWPSLETLAKVLDATGATLDGFSS